MEEPEPSPARLIMPRYRNTVASVEKGSNGGRIDLMSSISTGVKNLEGTQELFKNSDITEEDIDFGLTNRGAKNIICIDSDANDAQSLEDALAAHSFEGEITVCASYKEARKVLQEFDKKLEKVSAIFCNFRASESDVSDLLEEQGRKSRPIKVVVYSSFSLDYFEKYIKGNGAFAFLPLPFEQSKVKRTLRDLALI